MDDDVIGALGGVLEALWRIETEWPGKPCSLAKLSKQSQRPMSVLRRQLTMLEEAGLVAVVLDEDGIGGTAALSAAGRQMAADMFA